MTKPDVVCPNCQSFCNECTRYFHWNGSYMIIAWLNIFWMNGNVEMLVELWITTLPVLYRPPWGSDATLRVVVTCDLQSTAEVRVGGPRLTYACNSGWLASVRLPTTFQYISYPPILQKQRPHWHITRQQWTNRTHLPCIHTAHTGIHTPPTHTHSRMHSMWKQW